jgi:AraC-like DNA-binding protein
MSWQELQWHIPLEYKPTIFQMAMGIHGPNQVRTYRFPDFWCVHLYRYEGELYLDGRHVPIRPGYAGLIPPGVTNKYHQPHDRSIHIFAHFQLPHLSDKGVPILAMQDLNEDFVPLNQMIERALSHFSTHVRRAEVILWELLWQLAERTPARAATAPQMHPAVQQAIRIIETRLTEPISVADVVHAVDLSHNHLTRLFRATFSTTIVGYIQQRRVQHAQHLLIHSTLPIKAIAAEVGIHDLHQFNKMIRRSLGAAPRCIRSLEETSRATDRSL